MVVNVQKRGQVTIFVILAILLIVVALSVFYFLPKIKTTTSFDDENPNLFLQSCLEDPLQETIRTIGLQGGSMEPENPIPYYHDGENLETEIFCYTQEYNAECITLIPSPLEHFKSELEREIKPYADDCFNQLVEKYESNGYTVHLKEGDLSALFLSRGLSIIFSHEISAEKRDTFKFDSFRVSIESKMFNLLGHARNILYTEKYSGQVDLILDYEAQDFDLDADFEPYRGDGVLSDSIIYKLRSKSTGEELNFGIRSMVLSPTGGF